jgi:hypothetical protein
MSDVERFLREELPPTCEDFCYMQPTI